tara:strand:- start:4033 stop:5478 length:1446 start_codon:yes stop_codon:yes gene_type:complete
MNRHLYTYELIYKAEQETFKVTDSFEIMKKAALTSYEYIIKKFANKKFLIFCGPGNNGGDGILIAKYLLEKNQSVKISFPISKSKTPDSIKAFVELNNEKIIDENPNFDNYDIIIDAIFGTGLKNRINDSLCNLINKINSSKKIIISIDIPSGININTGKFQRSALRSNETITFHRFKPGQWLLPGKEHCGKINLMEIDLADLDSECKIQLNYPENLFEPNLNQHKFNRGSCVIIAGKKLIGASKLAFLSASQSVLRSGAGLCSLFVEESQKNIFKPHVLEEMIVTFNNFDELKENILNYKINSIIYGCGIENDFQNINILEFLINSKINLVLDAAVFSMIVENKNHFIKLLKNREAKTILTPHEGEFGKVFKITDNKIEDALLASKETNAVVVYKGNDTVIASPEGNIIINYETSPYLATAGSGDVLAGIIGGLISQQNDPFKAAKIGCYIHSQCALKSGAGLIASDLIKLIPEVIKEIK